MVKKQTILNLYLVMFRKSINLAGVKKETNRTIEMG